MVRTQNGYAVVPAQQTKQAIEDSPMEFQWLARAASRSYTLPNGEKAYMNPLTGQLIPVSALKQKAVDFYHKTPFSSRTWRRLWKGD